MRSTTRRATRIRPAWIMCGFLALAPLVIFGAIQSLSRMRNDVTQWLPRTYPETRQFAEFVSHFEPGAFVLVSWEGCTLDDPRVAKLAETLVGSPDGTSTTSRSPNFAQVITGPGLLSRLMAPPTSLSRAEALERLEGVFIGKDGKSTCAVFWLSQQGIAKMRGALRELYQTAESTCGLREADLKLGGPPVDNVALDIAGEQSVVRVLSMTIVLGLIVCWWCLRDARLIAMVLATGVYTVAASLSVFYFTGGLMDAVVLTMPPLVYVAAISGAIHLANYYRELVPVVGLEAAPRQAVREAALPLGLATFTTAAGLLSLSASELVPIRNFGIYSAVGVLIGLGLLLFFLPTALALWPIRRFAAEPVVTVKKASRIDWRRMGHWVINRPNAWAAAVLLLTAAALVGFPRIITSVQIMRLFADDVKILHDYAWLESKLGPLTPVEVVVRFDSDCPLDFRERLAVIEALQRRLNALDHVGSSMSAATFAPSLRTTAQQGLSRIIPRRLGEQTVQKVRLLRHRDDMLQSGFLSDASGVERWRITLFVAALEDVDYYKFSEQVDRVIQPVLAGFAKRDIPGVNIATTGVLPIVYHAQNSLLDGMIIGYGTDILLIVLAMIVAVRSLTAGLLLFIPAVLPAAMLFGILGWTGVVVDLGTVMPPAVALGVTVDDVMHFLLRFRRAVLAGRHRKEAVMEAYDHCARAMYQSWAVLGLGVLAFSFSPFAPTRRFGLMMLGLLTLGLVGNLILLPALLSGPIGRIWQRRILSRAARRKDSDGIRESEETVDATGAASIPSAP